MGSGKFDALAAKVGSPELAGWITNHNPKVAARAEATRAKHQAAKTTKKAAIKGGSGKSGKSSK